MAHDLSAELAAFIENYIDSVEQLEILLLLSEAPSGAWTVEVIYAKLRSNTISIRRRLERLIAQGLVTVQPVGDIEHFSYQPATESLDAAVRSLSAAYKQTRVTVIERIFAQPPSAIQNFADAFRLRKDPNRG